VTRDGKGNLRSITSADGVATTATMDVNGFLASLVDATGARTRFSYGAGGLLSSSTDARGNIHTFTFDGDGRLQTDTDPAGTQTLTRSGSSEDATVTLTSAGGHARTYRTQQLASGAIRRTATLSDGSASVAEVGADGSVRLQAADGTIVVARNGGDPRFGLPAPMTTSVSTTTPGGLRLAETITSSATLRDPQDLLSLQSRTDTFSINGNNFIRAYDAATRTMTWTSPLGRQSSMVFDDHERIAAVHLPGFDDLQYGYDPRGRLATVTQGSRTATWSYGSKSILQDASGRTTTFVLDALLRPHQVTANDGATLQLDYDASGNQGVSRQIRRDHADRLSIHSGWCGADRAANRDHLRSDAHARVRLRRRRTPRRRLPARMSSFRRSSAPGLTSCRR
jgi:YD repeat-containing protein